MFNLFDMHVQFFILLKLITLEGKICIKYVIVRRKRGKLLVRL